MVLQKTMFFVTIRHVLPSEVVTVQVTVPMNGTVQDLRQRIHAETGVLPADQRVVFGGHLLSDEETLRDLGIGNDSTVFMVERIPEPEPHMVHVFGRSTDGRTVSVEINYDIATAYDLRVGIANEYECATDDVRIIFCGHFLEDNVSLRDIELVKHNCFHFVFR